MSRVESGRIEQEEGRPENVGQNIRNANRFSCTGMRNRENPSG